MSATQPTGELTLTMRELADDGWYPVVEVLGICRTHTLYVSDQQDSAVYVAVPEGGEMTALRRWGNAAHVLPRWQLNGEYETQVAAEDYVIEQARSEVRAEMNS